MKNRLKYAILTLLALIFFGSCQKDFITYNDHYDNGLTPWGPPTIEKVILASDTSASPTSIAGASFTTIISIKGTNLSQVKSIKFNDVETDLSTVYAINSEITVPVPRVLPVNVDNKLTVTTSKGSVSTDFEVSIPNLILYGLENEFSAPGDTVIIRGNNFDLYDVTEEKGSVKLNGRTLEIQEATLSEIKIVIPEGTPDNSLITISGGRVKNPLSCTFRNFGIHMLTFEGLWGDWVPITDGSNSGDPTPLSGIPQFVRLAADLQAWSWDPGRVYGGGFNLYEQDVIENPQNYMFQFEINTKKAISFGNLHMGTNGSYQWNPAKGGISFNTHGKWRTMRFELMSLGWTLTTSPAWNSLSFVYQPTAATSVDFSVSNARLVKKQ